MDFSVIASFIENVGFTIMAFLLMYKMVVDQNKAHAEEMAKMQEAITGMRTAIDNNTAAIVRLVDHMKAGEK